MPRPTQRSFRPRRLAPTFVRHGLTVRSTTEGDQHLKVRRRNRRCPRGHSKMRSYQIEGSAEDRGEFTSAIHQQNLWCFVFMRRHCPIMLKAPGRAVDTVLVKVSVYQRKCNTTLPHSRSTRDKLGLHKHSIATTISQLSSSFLPRFRSHSLLFSSPVVHCLSLSSPPCISSCRLFLLFTPFSLFFLFTLFHSPRPPLFLLSAALPSSECKKTFTVGVVLPLFSLSLQSETLSNTLWTLHLQWLPRASASESVCFRVLRHARTVLCGVAA